MLFQIATIFAQWHVRSCRLLRPPYTDRDQKEYTVFPYEHIGMWPPWLRFAAAITLGVTLGGMTYIFAAPFRGIGIKALVGGIILAFMVALLNKVVFSDDPFTPKPTGYDCLAGFTTLVTILALVWLMPAGI